VTANAPQRPSARYSAAAIALHWSIATLIVVNFVIGLRFDHLKGLALFNLMQWHKSFGVTVLALSLARFAWRLVRPPPPYPAHMPAWEKAAASLVHWGFYLLMIGLPITGWIIVSASLTNIPTVLYKAIPWPHIALVHDLPMAMRKRLEDQAGWTHERLAWGAAALLVLHVGAALRHQLSSRDEVLWRMAPIGLLKARRPPVPEVQ
jgi:cytochrome b561